MKRSQDWLTCLHNNQASIGFHGSHQRIERFCSEKIGLGGDPNSALGVFMTELVSSAIEYAYFDKPDQGGFVHIAVTPTRRGFAIESPEDFFGTDMPRMAAFQHFSSLRSQLINEGYDHVAFEGMDDVILVALRPESASIIARLTPEEAEPLEDYQFDGPLIVQYLQKQSLLLPQRTAHREIDYSPSPW